MNDFEIRRLVEDEWAAVFDLAGVAFGEEYTARLAAAGRVQEEEPGTVELADKLFSVGRAPFCATDF